MTIFRVAKTPATRMLIAATREAILDVASILYNVGMKRVVYFLLGLAVLVLAACVGVSVRDRPKRIPSPRWRARMTQALGRDVKLGNLKLSILSGKVEADDLSIAEDPAFGKAPFLKARFLSPPQV